MMLKANSFHPVLSFSIVSVLWCCTQIVHSSGLEEISLKGAFRFDGLVTEGWENEAKAELRIAEEFKMKTSLKYLDAAQDSISGIKYLRGRVTSGLAGFELSLLQKQLMIDVSGGIDWIMDWKVQPRGYVKIEGAIPVPVNRFVQNIKIGPEAWYTHEMFNGPAIKNRITSYGYAGELSWTMGPKAAGAMNYRREYLEPADKVLNSSYTASTEKGYPVDTDTLLNNIKQTFYVYAYHRFLEVLYAGYSFSWTHTKNDRRVITDGFVHEPEGGINPVTGQQQNARRYYLFEWAYYPYPTPRYMWAHSITISTVFTMGTAVQVKLNGAFPFYSQQEMKAIEMYYEPEWGTYYNAWNSGEYGFYTEKNTGPLTFGGEINVNITSDVTLGFIYDYFGFPYREWAYFTEDSYSLHTLSLSVKKSF